MIPMTVQTLILASPPNPSILVLCPVEDYDSRSDCRIVPIWIGSAEANQIGLALEGTKTTRPLSHDLLLDALTNLDTVVERVEIVDVRDQTFFARLILRNGERVITLDARPSDAVALAIRQGATILMAEDVLAAASFPFVFRKDASSDEELSEFHAFVQSLSPEDFKE